MNKKYYLVRSYSGGVWYGNIKSLNKDVCILTNARNWIKVEVIKDDLHTTEVAFVAEMNGFTAHGDSKEAALNACKEKWFSSQHFDEIKAEFIKTFSGKKEAKVGELYRWHGYLTGSCAYGRTRYMERHGLKDSDRMNLYDFLSIPDFGMDKLIEVRNEMNIIN
jgi:hypothetical protein